MQVAHLMVTAARTAPKARGIDSLHMLIVTEEEKDALAGYMEKYGKENEISFFIRDAKNIRNSPVVTLFGFELKPTYLNGCNFCGYDSCEQCKAQGGYCVFKSTDLGITIGSAVSVASLHVCDNRVMYSVSKSGGKDSLRNPFECFEEKSIFG